MGKGWPILGLLLAACGSHGGGHPSVPPSGPVTIPDVRAYLAQSVSPDTAGPLLMAADPWTYVRRDWWGGQIEQSFQRPDGNYETLWIYSDDVQFNAANGDGGEVYAVSADGHTVYISTTQDGSKPGVQQFGTAWPLFDDRVPDCPRWEALPPLTRACRATVIYPAQGVPGGQVMAHTIISEHGAGQVEVLYMAAGGGRLRWERRDHAGCVQQDTVTATPDASFEDTALGPLCDVRMNTVYGLPPASGITGASFGWIP